jgi:hypothetical protein
MSKEFPMTNAENVMHPTGVDLPFGLRHSFVINHSSLVIRPSIQPNVLRGRVYGH